MTYCTRADLEARFGAREIADLLDTEPNGTEDTGRLDGALADADALIDGYLATRYAVPIPAPVPPIVVGIACDLARLRLWDDNAPEEVRKRYDDAIKLLRDMSAGKASIPGASPATAEGGGIEYAETERIFTMDSLRGF